MTDPATPPKSDADRIAALEAEVAELRDICANLHNSIQQSFNGQLATHRAAWSRFLGHKPDKVIEAEIDAEVNGLTDSMQKARKLIWGEAGNGKE